MGGSGGPSGSDPDRDVPKKLREAEAKLDRKDFNLQLGGLLSERLSEYNDRDTNLVRRRLDDIQKALGELAEGQLDMVFGGSVAKHTYIEGLSDIDCLLILNDTNLEADDATSVLRKVAKELSTELDEGTTAEPGALAVTVSYRDGMEVQLVPAVRDDDTLKIPSSRVPGEWSSINPEKFREGLTKYNEKCAHQLIPTIKLAKAVIAQLPDAHQLSGYHVESLAIDAFKNYSGLCTPAAMLPHFFDHAKDRVLHPMTDSTGQSVHVDAYMGSANSAMRINAGHLLGRISRRMANASAAGSIAQWKDLFGDEE